jgi:hypothetical protein
MDNPDAALWIKQTFFPFRPRLDDHPIHMGKRGKMNQLQREDIVDIGRSVLDGEQGYLSLYTPQSTQPEPSIPADHTAIINGLGIYGASITALAGYSLWTSDTFTKVPSLNTQQEFSDRSVESHLRRSAARFADSLVLALTIGKWGESKNRIGLEGLLMERPSGDSKILFAPIEAGVDGRKSRSNHGIVYKIAGVPRIHRIYEKGDSDRVKLLEILRRNALTGLLLAIASNNYLV